MVLWSDFLNFKFNQHHCTYIQKESNLAEGQCCVGRVTRISSPNPPFLHVAECALC